MFSVLLALLQTLRDYLSLKLLNAPPCAAARHRLWLVFWFFRACLDAVIVRVNQLVFNDT